MGFGLDIVTQLFQYEIVEDVNQAVDLLIKHDNGWHHRFVEDLITSLCMICQDTRTEHANEQATQ
jgi:hypothetical protein